jgi:hypothetical protein
MLTDAHSYKDVRLTEQVPARTFIRLMFLQPALCKSELFARPIASTLI